MMLLNQIIAYCSEKRWVDSFSIAEHFGRDVSAIEGLLSTLENKAMMRKIASGCGAGKCGNCSTGCAPQQTIRYMWVG